MSLRIPYSPCDIRYHSPQKKSHSDRRVGSGIIFAAQVQVDISCLFLVVPTAPRRLLLLVRCVSLQRQQQYRDEVAVADVRRIAQIDENDPLPCAKELAHLLFQTVYLGSENSSAATRSRSSALAAEIGASHLDVRIDTVVAAVVAFFRSVTQKTHQNSGSTEVATWKT